MALLDISFKSKSLDMTTRMTALVPDSGPGPFPVFYLLHGLTGDSTAWLRRSSVERFLTEWTSARPEGIPMILVMPETFRFWYTNAVGFPPGSILGNYEDHFIKDVVPFVDRVLPTIPERHGRVIGGLSMGGYGSVKLALKYPQLFAAATSHSGAVMGPLHKLGSHPYDLSAFRAEFEFIFGKDWRGGPNDPAALADKCPPNLRPAMRIDCGRDDYLITQNRDFHDHLTAIGFPHEYEEFAGEHNWAYWDLHIQEAIAFNCRVLGI